MLGVYLLLLASPTQAPFSEELFCSGLRFRHPKAILGVFYLCDILHPIALLVFLLDCSWGNAGRLATFPGMGKEGIPNPLISPVSQEEFRMIAAEFEYEYKLRTI